MNQKNIKYTRILLNYSISFMLLFCFGACSSRIGYKKQILTYLSEEYEINVKDYDNLIVIFLKNGSCGVCEEKTIQLIEELNANTDFKILIHYRQNDFTVERLRKMPVEVIISKGNIMDSYGIILINDLLIHYKSGRIKYFGWLFQEELDETYKHFFSKK
ncbi:MAG: hypothetical protein GX102_00990 [Porphyromonadaceae bacterium]|nr:hypothetical protein [Porphyromonadaceae bacterium]